MRPRRKLPVQPVLFGPVTTMLKINILALYFLKHAHSGTISLHKWNIKKHKSNSHFSYWHLWVFWNFVMSISRFWGSEKLELYFKPSCHRYCRKPSKSPASEEVACVRLACQGVPNEADGFNNSLQLDYDFTMWRGLKATLITEHDKVLKQKCWVLCKLADNFVNSTWVSDFTLFIVSSVPSSFNF